MYYRAIIICETDLCVLTKKDIPNIIIKGKEKAGTKQCLSSQFCFKNFLIGKILEG